MENNKKKTKYPQKGKPYGDRQKRPAGENKRWESAEAAEMKPTNQKADGAPKKKNGAYKKNYKAPYKKEKPVPYKKGGADERGEFDNIKSYGGNYAPYAYDEYDDDAVFPAEMYSDSEKDNGSGSVVVGRNAVRELLRSERSVDKLYVKKGNREGSLVVIVAEAVSRGIPVIEVSGEKLDFLSEGVNHQGVVAMAAEKQYTDVDGILKIAEERGEIPLIVIADCIEDPGNLGALIRCAECAGAHGIIIPKRRSAGLTSAVSKASAGAIEHMAIAKVSNISSTIESLKKKGLWIFASEAGATPFYETDFKVPAAIIFGSEGAGIGRMLKEKCDFLISIPMYGKVNSLNVSTAASVILCHAARMQRS